MEARRDDEPDVPANHKEIITRTDVKETEETDVRATETMMSATTAIFPQTISAGRAGEAGAGDGVRAGVLRGAALAPSIKILAGKKLGFPCNPYSIHLLLPYYNYVPSTRKMILASCDPERKRNHTNKSVNRLILKLSLIHI